MEPDLPPELWLHIIENYLSKRNNFWQLWLGNYRHVSHFFRDVVEQQYIDSFIKHMGINFDPGLIDDEVWGQDYEPMPVAESERETGSGWGSGSASSSTDDILTPIRPLNGPPQGLLLRFDRLQCGYMEQSRSQCDHPGDCHRNGRIAVLSRTVPGDAEALSAVQRILKRTMDDLPNGLSSHRRLFIQFERMLMSTDLLPADLHFFNESSADGTVKICLCFDWRRYLTTFLQEERAVCFENERFVRILHNHI